MLDRLKESLPIGIKKNIKRNFERLTKPFGRRVFCISVQRNGTTSVGNFLQDHGYRVARWDDSFFYNWPYLCSKGNYESVFKSNAFKSYNAFEDSPWFHGDIYRILFNRFPKSRFILLYRDSDDWFESMVKYSNGKTLGNTYRHCKIYRRLSEYYEKLDNDPNFNPTENEVDNLMRLKGKKDHYIKVYEEYNRDVIEFFNKYGEERLFVGRLEDSGKWQKLGEFLGIEVDKDYNVHANKSKHEARI